MSRNLYPRASLMAMPNEVQAIIQGHLEETPSKYCYALTCKRALRLIIGNNPPKRELALRANNTNGPWKQELMLSLNRGWIPKDTVKFCNACWRFMPYGKDSEQVYQKLVATRPQCYRRSVCHSQNFEFRGWSIFDSEFDIWIKDWAAESKRRPSEVLERLSLPLSDLCH